jgi:hypothetical protein
LFIELVNFCITLPEPRFMVEAAFIAIVFDGPGLALGKLRQVRYLVLEYQGVKNAQRIGVIGEWSPNNKGRLKYAVHGNMCALDATEFLNAVRKIIEASGTQPSPAGGV